MSRLVCRIALLLVVPLVVAWGPCAARRARADWPQWRGPNRDDISAETDLLKTWPSGGPPRVWLFKNCGLGYSGPAIVKDRLYIMGARDGQELLLAIDATSGEQVWASPIGEMLENNWGNGPRGTPTVDGELIYAIGGQGKLLCVQAADGKVLWTKSLVDDLGGKTPTWGFTESPYVHGEIVICTPGGEQGALAGLQKTTGQLAWRSKELTSGAHYASIVPAQRKYGPECVQLLPDQLVGFDPQTGRVNWTEGWPGQVAVIPTPIVDGNYVYATSGYGVGCKLLEVSDDRSVKVVYENKVMKNHHGGVVLLDGKLYGYSDDLGWVCQDFMTGKRVWREERDEAKQEAGASLGKGAIAYADGRLYCLGEEDGQVVLIESSPDGWKEQGRFTLEPQTTLRKPAGRIWTHPVICDGRLYLRDQELLFCFDVRAGNPGSANAGGN
ncbi:MAG: PQQ-like beta-propeller repeat protein [Pirellulales bacterium]|nr:PQQ-like beta-propeller repeat protein [Pirellulales bacterium]